jgi:protoporphyrinogen oxidase
MSFEVGGTPLECFYHHVFPHERWVIGLIEELGLGEQLGWFPASMGAFVNGRPWPFTSPLDLLRFRPIPLIDRLHAGVGALRLQRTRDWERLDTVPARDWLRAATGERAAAVVWDPLLEAKFGTAASTVPAAWMWGRFKQRAGARQHDRGKERLGYLRGGFRQMFDALHRRLQERGVDVRTGTPVERIACDAGGVGGVETAGGPVEADAVIFTGALPRLAPLVPEELHDPRWTAIRGLGAQCAILELERPLGTAYWTNVCDAELPFGGIIEHTNLVPAEDYGGRHVVYLSRYFTGDEAFAATDAGEQTDGWLRALDEHYPAFPSSAIMAVNTFRTPYAAPLVTLGYRDRIPPMRSSVPGLFVATTAQIYPDDRGMSEGVRMGTEVAQMVAGDAAR